MANPISEEILQRCRNVLCEHYEERLAKVVLYGSEARDTAEPDSDIDLLVVLHEPFDFSKELRVIVDLLYPVQLDSERHISARPAYLNDYEAGTIQLYRNIKQEGIAV